MKIDREALQAEFVRRLGVKWEKGAREYGDESFRRPVPETTDEILDEIVDVAGWAFVAWVTMRERFAGMNAAIRKLEPDTVEHLAALTLQRDSAAAEATEWRARCEKVMGQRDAAASEVLASWREYKAAASEERDKVAREVRQLDCTLFNRPAGRSVIGHAIDTIAALRATVKDKGEEAERMRQERDAANDVARTLRATDAQRAENALQNRKVASDAQLRCSELQQKLDVVQQNADLAQQKLDASDKRRIAADQLLAKIRAEVNAARAAPFGSLSFMEGHDVLWRLLTNLNLVLAVGIC